MTAYEHLTARAQVKRLRGIAEAALVAYGLTGARLTLLHHWDNTVFRVETAAEGRGERYALRIHHPANQNILPPEMLAHARAGATDPSRRPRPVGSTAMLRSELLWLLALGRETDLGVPQPVPTERDDLLVEVMSAGVPEPRSCVLFRWVEGRFRRGTPRPAELEQVGAFIGRLHEHAAHFCPPAGFVRQRWDWEGRFDPSMALAWHQHPALVPAEDAALLDRALAQVQATMQALGRTPNRYGLIHADLSPYNVLFYRGQVRAIDFDDCGWGYFLYDLALPLSYYDDRPDFPALRAALLRGYRRIRSLPVEEETLLPTFLAARRLLLTGWALERMDNPAIRDGAAWFAPRSATAVRRYLEW